VSGVGYPPAPVASGGTLAGRLVTRVQEGADALDIKLDLSLTGRPRTLSEHVEQAIEEAARQMLEAADASDEIHRIRLAVEFREAELYVSLDHDGTLEQAARARTEVAVLDVYELLGAMGGGVSFSTGRGFGARVELTLPYEEGVISAPQDALVLRGSAAAPQRAPVAASVERLTPQEAACLALLAAGYSNKEIAAQLFISLGTVKFHLAQIYQKLDVQGRGRGAAVARARELGLIFD